MKHFLAVDLGATSGRTVLAAFDGKKIEMRELTRFRNPIIHLGGHLYWDLPMLYHEVLLGLRKAAQEGVELTSIGIDTWGCDFAYFGSDGQLLGLPYCYRDPHTEGAQQKFFERMPAQEIYSRTGIQFMDFNSLFQLDTIRRNGGSALEAADKILFIPDALMYMFTGKAVCEYTVASTSQMLNPVTGDLDGEILKTLGIGREKFGKLVHPGTVVGQLSPQVQEFTGLPAVKVVAVAGHDTGSAVLAVPANDDDFCQQFENALRESDEKGWRLPLDEAYMTQIKSNSADFANDEGNGMAGACVAAAFLNQFIEIGTKWIHLDIAGTADHGGKAATGTMIRSVVNVLQK